MKLIVGLGNPEKKYEKTRHNLGWRVVDCLSEKTGIKNFKKENKFNAFVAIGEFSGQKIILAKPLLYMNNSGQSVRAISDYFKIVPEDITVVHDEIDLPLGEIKIQENISSAGHKGVQSIIDRLKTNEFKRVRLGIRPNQEIIQKTEEFILEEFSQEEEKIVEEEIKKAAQLVMAALSSNPC
ncbi:MAG: aminoacyl-tRNA hydrolase [Candidatus Portnoybacteria bacterium CG10_big_fil_rev_8_21_14_0_10_43_39]|uniref:Peptidyl-tRNA hydrolase n=2 Tax=Candidatus Portnoyibacteriota TaxID=1817913 RepID=A0A2M7YLT7_9BACT|nr:MAG: aminoacyl-tRNA hydrolase [Candidatus Portnoybacteria bacterium CG_4_9_14_3_um_filter_43_11]PJE59506.1 MAG: aminoacyl-tRNA hydrolase [Candidatus Portnoybacteria bacterium CG10_big_fil_rev_8_21_14_0_10_43_39]